MNVNDFGDQYITNISEKLPNNYKVILCGDFNLNMFNPYNLASIQYYISVMTGMNFFPLIYKPTRFWYVNAEQRCSLIDHVWCNFVPGQITSGFIDCGLSDHLVTFCSFKVNKLETDNKIYFRHITDANRALFYNRLQSVSFTDVMNMMDCNEAMNELCTTLYRTYNDSFSDV
jgi:hypothetical protein